MGEAGDCRISLADPTLEKRTIAEPFDDNPTQIQKLIPLSQILPSLHESSAIGNNPSSTSIAIHFLCYLMLHLQSTSSERWLKQVDENLNTILIDHAHCEQKAASTAMNLMFEYVENEDLATTMTEIVTEELEHFHMVRKLLKERSVRFIKIKPGTYGRKLKELCRRQEPERAIDRLLIAAIIEARSCERFVLLRDHLEDERLSEFYGSLYESEARHHATYVKHAMQYGEAADVMNRLEELAIQEAEIIAEGCELPRVHS